MRAAQVLPMLLIATAAHGAFSDNQFTSKLHKSLRESFLHRASSESAARRPRTEAGADSVTVYNEGHRGLSSEVLHFGPSGKVRAAFAHYAEGSQQRAAAEPPGR